MSRAANSAGAIKRRLHGFWGLTCLAGVIASVAALAGFRRLASVYLKILGGWFWWVAALLFAAIVLCAAATVVQVVRAVRGAEIDGAGAARRAVYAFCAIGLGFVLAVQPYARPHAEIAVAVAFGVHALLLLGQRRLSSFTTRPFARRVDLVLCNLCVLLIGGELALDALALVLRAPLLVLEGDSAADRLAAARYPAGFLRYGFPCNLGGHYDEPFARKQEGERLVVCIGDSFSAGIVPHYLHFTTVCERLLPGVRVCNMGLPGTDPADYLQLLRSEALAVDPDLITVQLFVGNDLCPGSARVSPFQSSVEGDFLRSFLDRERLRVLVIPRRMLRVWSEGGAGRAWRGRVRSFPPDLDHELTDPEDLRRFFPYLDDPLLEQAVLPAATFERIEIEAARMVCGVQRVDLTQLFATVDAIVQAASPVPVLFVLIPDALQVEDSVFARVQEACGRPLQRRFIQKLLQAGLEQRTIPSLDLLPRLLEVAPLSDDQRHCYHLSDTHFNARGNAVAGAALAEFLSAHLPR